MNGSVNCFSNLGLLIGKPEIALPQLPSEFEKITGELLKPQDPQKYHYCFYGQDYTITFHLKGRTTPLANKIMPDLSDLAKDYGIGEEEFGLLPYSRKNKDRVFKSINSVCQKIIMLQNSKVLAVFTCPKEQVVAFQAVKDVKEDLRIFSWAVFHRANLKSVYHRHDKEDICLAAALIDAGFTIDKKGLEKFKPTNRKDHKGGQTSLDFNKRNKSRKMAEKDPFTPEFARGR